MTGHHPLRVGVVGTGGWGTSFWHNAKQAPEVEMGACWDPRLEAAQRFAGKLGCDVAPSLDALLGRPDIEAVTIFSPNSHHRAPAELAAAAGKHVFTDKPIANTIEDGAAMVRACRSAGVTLMVGHSTRYHGAYRTIKSLLDESRLGTLAMAEGNVSHSGGSRLTKDEWRWHRDEAPGGPLMQLSVHMFDTMHYLFGPTRRVTALSTSSLTDSEIEDVFLALLEFESGLLAYVGTNYVAPPISYLRVYGIAGNAYSQDGKLILTTTPDQPWSTASEELPVPEINPHAAEMTEFARAVRAGDQPETGGREGLLALAVAWAAIVSAEHGRAVTLKEVLGEATSLL